MAFFEIIAIGLIAGWLAGLLMAGKGFGLISDLVVGVMGALIGGALSEKIPLLPGNGIMGSLILATFGAIVLLYGTRMIKKA
jgi:uncharacterized membrane protein YeaQ/YmgE (transglycosylase-associated protein family)